MLGFDVQRVVGPVLITRVSSRMASQYKMRCHLHSDEEQAEPAFV